MHRICLLFLSFMGCLPLLAQKQQGDSLIWLKPAEISALRFDFSDPAMDVHQIDTSLIAKLISTTLSDILQRESGAFMKSYGPGSLSTISQRGCGAAHTALLWNGLSLNSPMLGLYDFSLLPVFLLGDVRIQNGGNGPLVGSGAVGGVIFIDNPVSFEKGWNAEAMAAGGSFGMTQVGAGLHTSNGKVVTQTKLFSQKANNNFTFTNPEGKRIEQPHAGFQQLGISHDLSIGKKRNHLDLHGWYLQNSREIPPHMLALISRQEQWDESIRAAVNWSAIHKSIFWNFRGGLNMENIHYKDPAALLDEKSAATTFQSDGEVGYAFNNSLRAMAQVAWLNSKAKTDYYSGNKQQEQFSLGLKIVYQSEKLQTTMAIRQGVFDNKSIPFLPSFNARYNLCPSLFIRTDISGVYRIPTLNDRFWQPGGNKNLLPEKGFTSSLGTGWTLSKEKIHVELTAGIFYSTLKQAIVWVPGTDGLFSAVNIHTLESQGIEGGLTIETNIQQLIFRISFEPSINSSVIKKSDSSFENAIDKQLIYTPKILYKSQATIGYKSLSVRYYHNYTGYRFTAIDHSAYLNPFEVAELALSWDKTIHASRITFTVGIKNLYNEEYQVIAWRAMPGRSFSLGVLVNFTKTKNENTVRIK